MRIAPVHPGSRPERVDLEAQIQAARGRISSLYRVLLNSPPIAGGWEQLLSAVRNRSSLTAALREMVILRVAVLNRAGYEFEAHVPHAQAAGVSPQQIDALCAVPLACGARLDTTERVALARTDAMTRDIELPERFTSRCARTSAPRPSSIWWPRLPPTKCCRVCSRPCASVTETLHRLARLHHP
jgi:AhpD family alkylhydroperoxidase